MRVPIKKKYFSTDKTSCVAMAFVFFITLDILEQIGYWIFKYCGMVRWNTLLFNVLRMVVVFITLTLVVRSRTMILRLITLVVSIGIIIGLSLWVNPKLQIMIPQIFTAFVGTYIPAMSIGMCIVEKNNKILSYSVKMLPLVYLYIAGNLILEDLRYVYQNVAYAILFFAMASLALYCQEHKKSLLVHYIILLFAIVYLGARGVLLCMAVWTMFVIYYTDRLKIRRAMTVFGIIFLTVLYIGFWDKFIIWLYGLLPESRIIAQLYKGNFWESGRSALYKQCYEILKTRWIQFGGMMADRFYLVDTFKNTRVLGFLVEEGSYRSVYAHNIWLELCFCFGSVMGTIIIAFLIYKTYNMLKCAKSQGGLFLLICIVIAGFVPLLFSNSFWSSSFFWIMIGSLSMNRVKRKI